MNTETPEQESKMENNKDETALGKLLTLDELAKKLKVSKTWLYSRTGQGLIPGMVKIGRYCRFNSEEVEAWLRQLKENQANK